MKMNWGSWIVVSFILFALGTFTMVYISMTTKVDLVSDDYYEKELKYQNHIELVKNTTALEKNVDMEYNDESLVIRFPEIDKNKNYSGTIHFFRPSDKRGDFSREVELDSNYSQSIPLMSFTKGLWRTKISWSVGEKNFYSEFPIIIR